MADGKNWRVTNTIPWEKAFNGRQKAAQLKSQFRIQLLSRGKFCKKRSQVVAHVLKNNFVNKSQENKSPIQIWIEPKIKLYKSPANKKRRTQTWRNNTHNRNKERDVQHQYYEIFDQNKLTKTKITTKHIVHATDIPSSTITWTKKEIHIEN